MYGPNGKLDQTFAFSEFLKREDCANYNPENCVIRLLARDEEKHRFVDYEDFVLKNARKVTISFSPDGKWIAIFRNIKNILRIYKIEKNGEDYDIKKTLKKI